MKIVGQIDGDEDAGGTGVDTHVVGGVVEEFGTGVSLHVVGIVVTPPQLNVDPILLGRGGIHHVPERRAWKERMNGRMKEKEKERQEQKMKGTNEKQKKKL